MNFKKKLNTAKFPRKIKEFCGVFPRIIKKAISHHLVDFWRKNTAKYGAKCSVTDRSGYAPSHFVCLSCIFLVNSLKMIFQLKSTILCDIAIKNKKKLPKNKKNVIFSIFFLTFLDFPLDKREKIDYNMST